MSRVSTSPTSALPARPNLEHLKKLAKQRLKSMRAHDSGAQLASAQLAVAREHGFASWRALKAHIEFAAGAHDPAKVSVLLNAVAQGQAELVSAMLQQDPSLVNASGPHPSWGGMPQALHVAIERGDNGMFRLLLDAGADIDGDNRAYDGWSPLMLAVHWKRDAMRDALLKRGATVGLIEALMLGDVGRVRALLRDPSSLKGPFPNQATPLHFARTVASAKLLIDAGVDLRAEDKYGKRAIDVAATSGADIKVLRLMLGDDQTLPAWMLAASGSPHALASAARKDPSILRDPAVLKAAVQRGGVGVVQWLLAQGADVAARTAEGATLLHVAAWEGHLDVVKLLIQRGADPRATEPQHHATPAAWARHAATHHNRPACLAVAEYLDSVMDGSSHRPTAVRNRQWKPIMDAAFLGDVEKAKRLLRNGADPNVVSGTAARYRPLHRAIEPKKMRQRSAAHEQVVKVLLENGADPKLRGGFVQLTALQLAATGDWRFVPILLPHFEPLDVFHAAAVGDDKRVAELLQEDRSLATAKDVNRWQPLHYCCASAAYRLGKAQSDALVRIARALLKHGADPGASYLYEKWPLTALFHCCGHQDNPALAELLLRTGANPFDNETVFHAADEDHRACLAVLEEFCDPKGLADECTKALRTLLHFGRSRATQWLLEHGADPNSLHPESGDSALHSAVKKRSNDRIIRMLLKHGADPMKRTAAGKTAFDLAKGSARITKVLRQHP